MSAQTVNFQDVLGGIDTIASGTSFSASVHFSDYPDTAHPVTDFIKSHYPLERLSDLTAQTATWRPQPLDLFYNRDAF